MFRIHRQQPGAGLLHSRQENLAGGDQALLVGQRDACSLLRRREGRPQPGRANDCRHDPSLASGRIETAASPADASMPLPREQLSAGETGRDRDGGMFGTMPDRKCGQFRRVRPGRERDNIEALGGAADQSSVLRPIDLSRPGP